MFIVQFCGNNAVIQNVSVPYPHYILYRYKKERSPATGRGSLRGSG